MLQHFAKGQLRGRLPLKPIILRKAPFSSGRVRLATIPPIDPKPPKRHRVRNFFLGTALFLGLGSVGVVYYSLKDDNFYYMVTTYVPFANKVIDSVDDFIFDRKVLKINDQSPFKVKPSNSLPVETVPVGGSSKASAEITKPSPKPETSSGSGTTEKVAAKAKKAKDVVLNKPSTDDAPKQELAAAPSKDSVVIKAPKPAKSEAVDKEQALPQTKVSKVDDRSLDPLFSEITDAINMCARAHDLDLKEDSFFSNLVATVKSASAHLQVERTHLSEKYAQRVNKETSSALQKADEEYLAAKLNLVESYNNRLQLALDAVTRKAIASANNKITAQYSELCKQFGNKVFDYVEQERDGRLSQMSELKKDIETLQEAMLSSGRILESEDGVVSFFVELGNLQRVLTQQDVTPLKPYIDSLTKALPSDPLVQAVANSISPSVKKYGVLSHTQLAARFSLIEPKIRQASLAPPDAGIAGHLGSLAASQLLARKDGLPEGKDVESILARTQTHLQQGDILRAVAEVNSLQGWPKKIAADWLDEGRKRSEIEFLVNVLSDEGRLWSISRK